MTKKRKNAPKPSIPVETAPDVAPIESVESTPPPEPWTPAKVLEWNAYYDMYIAIGVVLLTLLVSTTRATNSSLWIQLQNGRTISESFSPQLTDTFSYTEEGKRWVNVPWLANVIHYQVFKIVGGFAPPDTDNLAGQAAKADQWGITGLIFLAAALRGLTAYILLSLRHKGPGLWWSSACVGLAFCYTFLPADLLTSLGSWPLPFVAGGLAGRASPSPDVWGGLFFALELAILHQAIFLRKRARIFLTIPLFLFWANFDESFFVGLLVLLAAVIGLVVKPAARKDATGTAPSLRDGLIAFVGSAAVTLINPSFFWIYPAVMGYFLPQLGWIVGPVTTDQRSPFSPPLIAGNEDEIRDAFKIQGYYFTWVGLGLVSFLLNRRRFNLSRFLMFAVASGLWAVMFRWQMEFALTLAFVFALNGQEWFQDHFGGEGHLGKGWSFWSIGGRAVTLLALSWFLFEASTGFGSLPGDAPLSIGFNTADFPFEAAEYLAKAPIEGNVFNTSLPQGDALIWKSKGKRKSYIDSRRHLFSKGTLDGFTEIQRALSEDNVELWREPLSKYNVSVVVVEPGRSPRTYKQLMTSPRWIPFRDDGSTVLFGRADAASAADVALFKNNQLDPDTLVYKNPTMVPSSEKLPRATTGLDRIYLNRFMQRPEPHSIAAARWLSPVTQDPNLPFIPEPSRAIMAIREARSGLAINADDALSYRRLVAGYRTLLLEESAMLNGLEIKPENTQAIGQTAPRLNMLGTRRRQLITAFTYAIQTTPPPQSPEARLELAYLNIDLAQIFLGANYFDLARDHFKAAIDGSEVTDLNADMFNTLTTQLQQLNQAIQEVETQLQTMSIEQQAGPLQQAAYAQSQGAIGLAIQRLEEAQQAGLNPALVKGTLLDLYCEVGMVDKALELWDSGNIGDPNLADRDQSGQPHPGTAAMRQGRVFLLLGNYASAIGIWTQQALPQIEGSRIAEIPNATRSLLRGDAQATTRTFLNQPDELARQAYFEFDIALAALEAGLPPEETIKHFTQALKIAPDLQVRPVAAYYLAKFGAAVPPTREELEKAKMAPKPGAPGSPTPTPAATSNPTPAAAPTVPPAAKPAESKPGPATTAPPPTKPADAKPAEGPKPKP